MSNTFLSYQLAILIAKKLAVVLFPSPIAGLVMSMVFKSSLEAKCLRLE